MASVRFRINIKSSTTSSDLLDFTIERDTLVVPPFKALSRETAVAATPLVILPNTNARCMFYFKNLDVTNYVDVTNTAGHVLSRVSPGAFCLLSVKEAVGVSFLANVGNCLTEYGYWTV